MIAACNSSSSRLLRSCCCTGWTVFPSLILIVAVEVSDTYHTSPRDADRYTLLLCQGCTFFFPLKYEKIRRTVNVARAICHCVSAGNCTTPPLSLRPLLPASPPPTNPKTHCLTLLTFSNTTPPPFPSNSLSIPANVPLSSP